MAPPLLEQSSSQPSRAKQIIDEHLAKTHAGKHAEQDTSQTSLSSGAMPADVVPESTRVLQRDVGWLMRELRPKFVKAIRRGGRVHRVYNLERAKCGWHWPPAAVPVNHGSGPHLLYCKTCAVTPIEVEEYLRTA